MKNVITLRMEANGNVYHIACYSDEAIQISKRVRTVEEIESAQGTITKLPFRVLLIGEALELFGSIDSLNSNLPIDIRKSIHGSILINNFPRFKGSFSVLAIHDDVQNELSEVELIFKGEETTLKQDLGEMTLAQLFEGETVRYNRPEIGLFFLDPQGYLDANGIAWPLIDYGQRFTGDGSAVGRDINGTLTQTDFKPALGIKKILSMLWSKLNISIDFDMDNATDKAQLLNHVIPLHNNDSNVPTLTTNQFDGSGKMFVDPVPTTPQTIVLSANVPQTIPIPFSASSSYSIDNFDVSNKKYTAPDTGNYGVYPYFKMRGQNISGGGVNIRPRFFLKVNGVIERTIDGFGMREVKEYTDAGYQIWDFFMFKGDELTIEMELEQTFGGAANESFDFNFERAEIDVNAAPAISASSHVILSENIPGDLTAWDVVKSLITMVNGVVVPSSEGYSIVPWVEWIEEGERINIDSKVESSQSIKITPTSVDAPKRILFTYEEDEDVANETFKRITGNTYGQLLIADTGTDLGTETKEVKIPFAPTPPLAIAGTNMYIPKFVDAEWKTVKTKPRLLKMSPNDVSFGVSFILKDEVILDEMQINQIPQFIHWETPEGGFNTNDWNWGTTPNFFSLQGFPNNTLYKRYWEKYIVETYGEYGRKVNMKLFFTQFEFDKLKLNEEIYYRGSKLRFNSISGFDISNEVPVSVEMISRRTIYNIDIAPYYPYDVINGIVQFKDSSDNSIVASPDPADLKTSCEAYGFYYDPVQNACIQRAELIQI